MLMPHKDPEDIKVYKKKYNLARKKQYRAYKRRKKCAVCGMSFYNRPECCDLHHRDGREHGEARPSQLVKAFSWAKVLPRLEELLPLCANCHRTLHKDE
jgi:hypothetical protein